MIELLPKISYLVFFCVFASIYSLSTLGLNLQWGFTGMLSVGIVGFFGVGAYAAAFLTGPNYPDAFGGFGLPVPIGFVGAMLFSGLVALIVGIPTIRLRHDFLAIGTFGIAVCIQLVAMNLKSVTRGFDGLHSVPKPFVKWTSSPLAADALYLVMTAAIVFLIYWALERMLRSPWGRVLRAIREDEDAAGSLGKNPAVYRLQSFVIGSMLMGLSGALYANFTGFVSPQDLLPIFTFQVFVMLIVGGSGNNLGAIVGTFVIWALWTLTETALAAVLPPALEKQVAALRVVLVGLILVLMLLFRPQGLFPEERIVSPEARLGPGKGD
ncbi:MAG: branched-chain amino acid ABC transporter permease [Rhodospirillaceae bacterium]|nr:branched-chain amino acid ABC transporter permease [Rhodospirillaceae bacterium]